MNEEIMSGMREWRAQHPKATLREMEDELDRRWARVRARMLEDMALAGAATERRTDRRATSPPSVPAAGAPPPVPRPAEPAVALPPVTVVPEAKPTHPWRKPWSVRRQHELAGAS